MSLIPQFRVPPHHTFTGLPDPDRGDVDHYGEGSQMHHSAPSQSSCFGLPYQDHNYGAPPPPTPPPSPPPPTRVNGLNGHLEGVDVDIENVSLNTTVITSSTSQVQEESPERLQQDALDDSIDDSITRCICDYVHDDGYMICCDRCSVWQHVDCMGVDRANIPEIYYCERCEPRKLNKQRAVQLQTRKREVLMIDTSATESENETKQFAEKPKNRKKKLEKRELPLAKLANGNNRKPKKLDKDGKRKQSSRKALHQPSLKKSPVKVNRLKPVRSPVAVKEEGTTMPWHSKQYADTYEEAPGNVYSAGVQDLLYQTKVNGGLNNSGGGGSHQARPPLHLQAQVCRVSQFGDNQKGLEALEHLALGQPLIEYKGNVMLQDQYNKEKFFFQRFQPHVLFYPDIASLDLCIDASTYGNDARHVRRSCCPNAEVRHFLEGNQVYFYIFTTKSIPKGYEITIPFDFSYQQCNYYVECACSKPNCAVAKFHKGITTNTEEIPLQVLTKAAKKQKKIPKALDEPLHIDIGKTEVKPPLSSPPTKRRRLSSHNAAKDKGTPVKEEPRGQHSNLASPKTPGLASPQFSGASDHEGEEADRASKKMSREDRKIAAIMKAFEKLEKQQERKKESQHKQDYDKCERVERSSSVREQETAEVKARQKARSKRHDQRQEDDLSPLSPLPPQSAHRLKDRKEKTIKESRKPSTEKKRMPKTESLSEAESENVCPVKKEEEEPEVKVEPVPPPASSREIIEQQEEDNVPTAETMCALKSSPVKREEVVSEPQEVSTENTECEAVTGSSSALVKEESVESDGAERGGGGLVDVQITGREERPRMAKGKKKRGGGVPARRKSRVNSSISTTTTDSADDESSSLASSVPPTPNTAGSSSTDPCSSTPQTPCLDRGFKFPKTKKHLMSEWLSEKSSDSSPTRQGGVSLASGRVEPLEISVGGVGSSEAEADFVKCVPSPHTNSLSHLRRSSVSSVSSHTRAVDSIPHVQLDSNMGSAKKRWLRQAMFERSTSVPVGKENHSSSMLSPVNPHSCTTSPAASPPVDFVTPLKKRRFARESLCGENPYGQAPSTPTHPGGQEEQEAFSPNSSLDQHHLPTLQEDQPHHTPTTTRTHPATTALDANKNGICVDKLNNLVNKDNIFEKIGRPSNIAPCDSVASSENERDSSHYPERKLLFDKQLSVRSRPLNEAEQEQHHQCDLSSIGCSQGFEVTDCEAAADSCSVKVTSNVRTFTQNESEAASTSTECGYSNSNSQQLNQSYNTDEKNCDRTLHRSGKTITSSPHHSLNLSGDSGLISDQEKTCSSSCLSESILQDSMCNSFDSTESVSRGHMDVDSSQGIIMKQACSHDVTSANSNTSEALHKTSSDKSCARSVLVASVDSSRDHKCLESETENMVDSLTGSSHCAADHSGGGGHHHSNKTTSSSLQESSVVSSVLDSVVGSGMPSKNHTATLGEDNTVSCSAQSSREAEARTVITTETEALPSNSSSSENKLESEKEEGEITDDDEEEEEEEVADSSSVVQNECEMAEKEVESSNEAENNCVEVENMGSNPCTTTSKMLSSSSLSSCCDSNKDISSQALYNRSESNQAGEVTSSRSTSPYWENGIYRKQQPGWWRQDQEVAAGTAAVASAPPHNHKTTPPSNHSSPSTSESPHSQQLQLQQQQQHLTDSKAEEYAYVDSTTEKRGHSSHSPVISSTDIRPSQQEMEGAMLEACESLSPGALADSLTSPFGFSHASAPFPSKKKVSLLEYRKRMRQKSSDAPPPSMQGSGLSVSRTTSSSSSSNSSTPSAPTTPLYPTLPLFPSSRTSRKQKKQLHQQNSEASPKEYSGKKKKEEEVKWCATATMAERVREQTHITLTERLRKEFGLDTVDEPEDREESDDDEPPPPPPPAPPSSQAAAPVVVLAPTNLPPPPPLPPVPIDTQSLSQLTSAQAQSLIQKTMLAVVNSAGAVGQLPNLHTNPLLVGGQNTLHLPISSSTTDPATQSILENSSQLVTPLLPTDQQSAITNQQQQQHLVTAISAAASTVLNNNKQQQPPQSFVGCTLPAAQSAVFLNPPPSMTHPPTHQFNHLPNNNSLPQLPVITQTAPSSAQDLKSAPLLPAIQSQPATTTTSQGAPLLPTPQHSLRLQQPNKTSADSTATIPSLLAIPTIPTKIFNRLNEEQDFVALDQGSISLQERDYTSSTSASEAPVPETTGHKQHGFPAVTQAQLLVNYNHGFPQTGINMHK